MTISGYAFTLLHVITSNWLINVTVVSLYIRGDEIRCSLHVRAVIRTSQQISLFTSHDDGQLQLQIKGSSLSAFRSTIAGFLHQSL